MRHLSLPPFAVRRRRLSLARLTPAGAALAVAPSLLAPLLLSAPALATSVLRSPAPVPEPAPTAEPSAAPQPSGVEHQAWSRPGPPGTGPLTPEPGRLYVGATGGNETARSYVSFTDDAPQITALTLKREPAPLASLASGGVAACLLTAPVAADGEIAPADAPDADCTTRVDGQPANDGTVTFDLAVFHAPWLNGAPLGVAVVASPANAAGAYEATFMAADTAVALTAGTPAPVAQPDETLPSAAPASIETSGSAVAPAPSSLPVGLPIDVAPAPTFDGYTPGALGGSAFETFDPLPTHSAEDLGGALPDIAPEASDEQSPDAAGGAVVPATGGESAAVIAPASVNRPATGWVLLAVVAALGLVGALVRSGVDGQNPVPRTSLGRRRLVSTGVAVAAIAALLVPLAAGGEATVYKVGLILIFAIGALGLHVLVNWAGELSLAHAAFVGVPALAVAKLASDAGTSPIVLLPVAVAVGALLGAVASLPALRVQGLYVAITTLGLGIAVDRFLFAQEWLVGPVGNLTVPVPRIGPFTLRDSRDLYLLVAMAFAAVVVALAALGRSPAARAMRWMKANPAAASAAGIDVRAYRVAAYVLAGALAGLAGGLATTWIQRVSAQSFPATQSFTYLSVVVMAGAGSLAGVVGVASVLEGARLFFTSASGWIAYAGPVGLVLVLTTFPNGVNGQGRKLMRRLQQKRAGRISLSFAAGVVSVVVGLVAIGLAWYHTGNTRQVWVQLQEIASGGLGGLALVILGTGRIIRDQLARNAGGNVDAKGQRSTADSTAATEVSVEHDGRPERLPTVPAR